MTEDDDLVGWDRPMMITMVLAMIPLFLFVGIGVLDTWG